jgi:hypothetical protein
MFRDGNWYAHTEHTNDHLAPSHTYEEVLSSPFDVEVVLRQILVLSADHEFQYLELMFRIYESSV